MKLTKRWKMRPAGRFGGVRPDRGKPGASGVFSGPELNHVYPNGNEVCGIDIVYVSRDFSGTLRCTDGEAVRLGFYPIDQLPQPISPMNAKQIQAYRNSQKR